MSLELFITVTFTTAGLVSVWCWTC